MAKAVRMEAEFLGVQQVLRALGDLGVPEAKKIGRRLLMKFARETREDMRSKAPVGATGKLRKSIKARSTRSGGAQVYADRRQAPHTHFADTGTKDRKTKAGARRGKVEGTKWLTNAQKRAKEKFSSDVARPLMAELVRTIKRGMKGV